MKINEREQNFKVYQLTSLVTNNLLTGTSYKLYFDGRKEKHDERLDNDKRGWIYIKAKTDEYVLGDYIVLPDKGNYSYTNVDTKQYTPLEEKDKKVVGGYLALFYIDLKTGFLFFQEKSEAISFKKVFNNYLHSKQVYLEDVYVDNPRESVAKLFGSFDEIEILKVGQESPANLIVNIGKSMDAKVVLKKQIFKFKRECKFKIEENAADIFGEINLEEYESFSIKGKDRNNKPLSYNILKEAILIKITTMIDPSRFLIEKDKDDKYAVEYVVSVFKQLHQDFQQNSSK